MYFLIWCNSFNYFWHLREAQYIIVEHISNSFQFRVLEMLTLICPENGFLL